GRAGARIVAAGRRRAEGGAPVRRPTRARRRRRARAHARSGADRRADRDARARADLGAVHLGRPLRHHARRRHADRALARGRRVSLILSPQEIARLRQAMLLGLARQPLAVPAPLQPLVAAATPARDAALTVLALAGQQQRFERATLERGQDATPEAARQMHADPRPIMPEPARRALLRLASGVDRGAADAVLSAAARHVMRAGFRLHPFDFSRLIGHIKGDARCLGLAERAYLALAGGSGTTDAPNLLHAEITAENWTTFPKGHRIAFLRATRR